MACYFGCGTGANKCAWFWWFLLLTAGAGCLVGWYVQAQGCLDQTDACFKENGVTADGLGFNPEFLKDIWSGTDATEVCDAFFPDDVSQMDGCVKCYQQVAPCFEPSLGIFVAGVVLACASFVACMFMCCCASSRDDYKY